MAVYAPTQYNGDTGTLEWAIGFPYVQRADLHVYIDGVEITFGDGADEWLFGAAGTSVVFQDGGEPQDGSILLITRNTVLADPVVLFVQGGGVTARNLNTAVAQLLYAIDEFRFDVADYDSGLQSMATVLDAGAPVDFPHGLAATPSRVDCTAICTAADIGYSVGDVVEGTGGGGIPIKLAWDATNITVITNGAQFRIFHKNATAFQNVDKSKWSLRLRAWR